MAIKNILKFFRDLIVIFSIFAAISCCFIQQFQIPSGSMIPTFVVGDFLVVNKLSYGLSNDSFRLWEWTIPLPKIKNRLFSSNKPTYGDVVVFRNTKDDDKNYIKRIVGLPGDKVEVKDGALWLNDKQCEIKGQGTYSLFDRDKYLVFSKYIQKLPNGYEHVFIKSQPFGQAHLDNYGPAIVPDGHYFLMGDNRDNSADSRVESQVGFVPFERIMGKAEYIFFSSSCKLYEILKWPFSIRFERIFTKVA